MGLWKKTYLPLYFVGESLSGLLAALVALMQGHSADVDNSNFNATASTDLTGINFSVEIFFLILFIMTVISTLAFMFLDYLPNIQQERGDLTLLKSFHKVQFSNEIAMETPIHESYFTIQSDDENISDASITHSYYKNDSHSLGLQTSSVRWPKRVLFSLLSAQLFASCLVNGFLPGIQPYSCAPYGNIAYRLATALSAFAQPLAAFTTAVTSRAKPITVFLLTIIGSGLAALIITIAALSPTPPLVGTTGGSVLIVSSFNSKLIIHSHL